MGLKRVELVVCDRCGKENTPMDVTANHVHAVELDVSILNMGGTISPFDLCGDCTRDYDMFMRQGKSGKNALGRPL